MPCICSALIAIDAFASMQERHLEPYSLPVSGCSFLEVSVTSSPPPSISWVKEMFYYSLCVSPGPLEQRHAEWWGWPVVYSCGWLYWISAGGRLRVVGHANARPRFTELVGECEPRALAILVHLFPGCRVLAVVVNREYSSKGDAPPSGVLGLEW